jgi:hypothetical protein
MYYLLSTTTKKLNKYLNSCPNLHSNFIFISFEKMYDKFKIYFS